jgi:peptidyl-prolyl cis-trans isomerase D
VLKFIRRNASALWVKIMFGAIAVVFMFWGVGAVVSSGGEAVAIVNGENIDPAQYKRAYAGMRRFYQNIYKDGFTPQIEKAMNLPARTVDQLISSSLLRQEADRLGFTATDVEVLDSIAGNTAFHLDGRFNRDVYIDVLRANGMRPSEYEEAQREEILVSKLRDLIIAGVVISAADVRARYDYDNEKVNLSFVKVDPEQYLAGLELNEEQIKQYYDSHQDEFRQPDRVELAYVVFPNAHYEASIDIPEAEVKEYYDGHQQEFHQEEQVRARHILIRVDEGADEPTKTAARQRAEDILAKAKAGEDFAKLATEHSEDSSSSRGGDLGFFRRGLMVPPFEEAAFAMKPSEISGVVETQFGYHIIRIEERTEEGTRPLAEVAGEITAKLKQQRAQDTVSENTTAAHVELTSGKSLEEIAAANGLEVKTTGPLAQKDRVAGVNGTGLLNAAFALDQPGIGPVVTTADGQIVFRVTNKIPSSVPELASIRDQVEKTARAKLAADKAKETAEKILAAAKEKGLEAAAQEHGLAVEESGSVGRADIKVGSIGTSPELAKQVFDLTTDSPVAPSVYDIDGDSIVVALRQRIPADAAAFDSQKEQLIEQAEAQLRNVVLNDFVTELRNRADVEIGKAYATAVPPT